MSRLLKDKKQPLKTSNKGKVRVYLSVRLSAALVKLTALAITSEFGAQGAVNQIKGGMFFPKYGHDGPQMAAEVSLLGALPVDGVIQLLHLLLCQDAVGEVRLELLQGQLPVVCEEKAA